MTFIHPILLSALAFLAVPILLQFLIHRKRVVIRWAAYEWMKKAIVIRRKQVRITEILKLISKLLLILFLVLFAARLLTRSALQSRTLVVIDTTLSMSATLESGTRLDKARELALDYVRKTDAQVAISTFDGRLNPVVRMKRDQAGVEASLRGIEVAPRAASVREFIQALTGDAAFNEADTILFISDFQKESYQDTKVQIELAERIGKLKNLVLLPVDVRSGLVNLGIESMVQPPEGCWPGRANRVGVVVRNYSSQPVSGVPVTLWAGEVKTDRAVISLDARSANTVWLSLPPAVAREIKLRAELPPDTYAADNSCYAVLDTGDAVSVLAAVETRSEALFESDLFLRSALGAFLKGESLQYKSVRPTALAGESLEGVDVVMAVGATFSARDRSAARLLEAARGGLGVVAFVNPATPAALAGLGVPELKISEGVSATPDVQHLREGYLDFMMDGGGFNPSLIHFYRFGLIPSSSAADSRLRLGGLPESLVVSRAAGEGRLILAGFLPMPGQTDFFYNPNFVPFMMRLFNEALGRQTVLALTGDDLDRIPLPRANAANGAVYTMRSSAGDQARLDIRRKDAAVTGSMPPLRAGAWCVVYEDKEPIQNFGYNLTRRDSLIEPARQADLVTLKNLGVVFDEKQSLAAGKARKERRWLLLLFLVAAVGFEFYAHMMRKR